MVKVDKTQEVMFLFENNLKFTPTIFSVFAFHTPKKSTKSTKNGNTSAKCEKNLTINLYKNALCLATPMMHYI